MRVTRPTKNMFHDSWWNYWNSINFQVLWERSVLVSMFWINSPHDSKPGDNIWSLWFRCSHVNTKRSRNSPLAQIIPVFFLCGQSSNSDSQHHIDIATCSFLGWLSQSPLRFATRQMPCSRAGIHFGAKKTGVYVISVRFHDDNEAKSHWREGRRLEKMEERGYGGRGLDRRCQDSWLIAVWDWRRKWMREERNAGPVLVEGQLKVELPCIVLPCSMVRNMVKLQERNEQQWLCYQRGARISLIFT